jgi:fatty-acyl-CoA synthase
VKRFTVGIGEMSTSSVSVAPVTYPAPTVTANWFVRRVRLTPDRPAMTFEGTTWTYERMWQEVEEATDVLRGAGVGPGDRVAYVGMNDALIFVMLLAANRLGAALVPLNFRLTATELVQLLDDARPSVVVADNLRQSVLSPAGDGLVQPATFLASEPGGQFPFWREAKRVGGPLPPVTGSDVATIMYTSGTSGRAKGVLMTHDNHWWGALNGATALEYGRDEVTLVMGPMFHVAGFCSTNIWTWMRGGHVIAHREFSPTTVLRDIEVHGVTSLGTVTTLLQLLAQDPDFETADLSSLSMIYCGGVAMPAEVVERFAAKGVPIQGAYGSTESVPVMTILPAEHALTKRLSPGRPAMFIEVRIVSGEGQEVTGPGARGEVWVRGPSVSPGYWSNQEATMASRSPDGWFKTGDMAEWDEDGFIYLVGRAKDLIKTGGETVAPDEVEAVLASHPSVQEVAVVGAPHPRWGETPVAVVVLQPGTSLALEELRDAAGDRLARFKLPTRLVVVDALPRNAAGKVLKYVLREQVATGADDNSSGSEQRSTTSAHGSMAK